MNTMKINQREYDKDIKIIWDELYSYAYEIEDDYWDADIIQSNYETLVYSMEYEYLYY